MDTLVLLAIFVTLVVVAAIVAVMGNKILNTVQKKRVVRLPADELPTEYLMEHHRLMRPLRQSRVQMEKLIEANPNSGQVRAMGKDLLHEADEVIHQCQVLVIQIDRLRKVGLQKPTAVSALATLRKRAFQAPLGEDHSSFDAAIRARESEIAHYDAANKHADALEGVVLQAQAAVAELHARLFTSVQNYNPVDEEADDLLQGLGRLRALRESVEEADELSLRILEAEKA